MRYECPCGYVYDPDEGDDMVPVGTAFEALPADWVCPKCAAEREYFEEIEK